VKTRLRTLLFRKFDLYRYAAAPGGDAVRAHGGAVQAVSSLDPYIKSTRFQPLSLSSGILVSKFAFEMRPAPLRHGRAAVLPVLGRARAQGGALHVESS
jgi:hypothetical protein